MNKLNERNTDQKQAPIIIAHRGCAGEAPENTLGSFRRALEQHCDAIELDIHLSKDGVVVVIHDFTVNRTTNGTGAIADMTVEELRSLDAGSWFHESYAGEHIPTLAEVFELVPPSVMVNVEVKIRPVNDGKLGQELLNVLDAYDRFDSVVVSSFDHKCLKRLKEADNRVKIGLLYSANLSDHTAVAQTVGVPVFSLHPHASYLGPEDVAAATAAGLQVYPYTINPIEQYHTVIQYGVSGIITDYPGRLYTVLQDQQ